MSDNDTDTELSVPEPRYHHYAERIIRQSTDRSDVDPSDELSMREYVEEQADLLLLDEARLWNEVSNIMEPQWRRFNKLQQEIEKARKQAQEIDMHE